MKNIKDLYLAAKNSGRQQDIDSYVECVNNFLENSPYEYISNLEYIISSNIGLSTLKEFVDKNGISISSYDTIMEHLENGIKKCNLKNVNCDLYKENVEMIKSFKEQYQNCFMMFEYFQDKLGDRYVEAYYKNFPIFRKVDSGKVNISGMISKFGESCIPDMLIYTNRFGDSNVLLENLNSDTENISSLIYQFISESIKDIPNKSESIIKSIYENSLQGIVDSSHDRNDILYRESVLTGNENMYAEYSHEEINAIKDLISFKEYQITCLENTDYIMKLQSEIYSLYEEASGLIEEDVADSVIPMLPGSQQKVMIREDSLSNTQNKKTGGIPDYLKRNHDMSYGEDEPDNPDKESEKEKETTLDDFKRASSNKTDDVSDNKIVPYDYSQDVDNSNIEKDDETKSIEDKKTINNYYYYHYKNSNNTNSNSYNKHQQDDHSSGKRINSDNNYHDKTEFALWTIDEISSIPLSELAHLPEEYYQLYNEAVSIDIYEGALATDLKTVNKPGEEKSVIEKIKEIAMKLINFLIKMYEKMFPKTLFHFMELENQFKESAKIQKMTKENDGILKIMDIEIPHIKAANIAVGELINYANTGQIPKIDIKKFKTTMKTRIAIYYGSYITDDNPSKYRFCLGSDAGVESALGRPRFGKDIFNVATYLSENTLLSAFGINIKMPNGRNITIEEFGIVMSNIKIKINLSPTLWKNLEARRNLLDILKALTDISDHVYKTMNQAYKSAKIILKSIETKHESANPFIESKAPWELDVFGNTAYNEDFKDIFMNNTLAGKIGKGVYDIGKKAIAASSFLKMPRTLYDIQQMDLPKFRMIPFLDKFKMESGTMDGALDLIDGPVEIFTEGVLTDIFGLSKNELREVVNNINKKCQADVLFLDFTTILGWVMAAQGGAACVVISKEKFEHFMKTQDYKDFPNDIPSEGFKNFKKVILINISFFRYFNWVKNPRLFELVFLHEYGHSMTFDQISADNFNEYKEKIQILQRIAWYLPSKYRGSYVNLGYWSTKVERLANEYSNIDTRDLLKIFKQSEPSDWNTHPIKNLGSLVLPKFFAYGEEDMRDICMKILPRETFEKTPYGKKSGGWWKAEPAFEYNISYTEAVGDADDQKPTSDNPIQDTMTDLDRKLASGQQALKKKVQGAVNTTRTIVKPFKRTVKWISNMVSKWKDSNENDIKERMADPHSRSNLFTAIRSAIKYGSLFKAGLLLNPIILYLTISKKWNKSSKEFRLRNEMIGEIKAELAIIDEKIKDAGSSGDNKAKYQLMRFRNELNKKLIRVGGTKEMAKMV